VWEAQMFSDPALIQFFKDEGIIFTNWQEIMKRLRRNEKAEQHSAFSPKLT
jgi:hypothetical protein